MIDAPRAVRGTIAIAVVLVLHRPVAIAGPPPASAPAPGGEVATDAEAAATTAAPDPDHDAPVVEETEVHVVWGHRADPEGTTVDEVSGAELARQGARSAAQALERLPALSASTGSRGERIFVLRGFDQRQTTVSIDGAPAHVPFDGQLDLDLLPVELIERVAVVKGPASVLLGPSGLGGAVSVTTRQPGRGPPLSLRAESAGPPQAQLALTHDGRAGSAGYTVYAGGEQRTAWPLSGRFVPTRLEDGGDRLNSDRRGLHAGAAAHLPLGPDHAVRASAMVVDAERGIPPSTLGPSPEFRRWTGWRALLGSLSHSGRYLDRLQLDELAYLRWFTNTLEGYDDATFSSQASTRAFRSLYDDVLTGGGLRARLTLDALPWGTTSLRLWSGVQLDAHREGETPDALELHAARALLTLAPEVEVLAADWVSLVASCQLDLELPGALSGARLDPQPGIGPLLSTTLRPVDGLMLRGTVARRVRFATLKERFATATGLRLPNPALRPESAWHLGLDAAWQLTPRLAVEGSVYDAEVADLIERVALGGGREQLQNLGAARLLGSELALRARPGRGLELLLGYAWLHARRLDGDSPYLPYRPEHKALLGAGYQPWPWLELGSHLRFVGPQRGQHPVSRAWVVLPGTGLWDARVAVRPGAGVELWVQGSNLLDADHATKLGFPDPGRQLWLGLAVVSAPPPEA